MDDEMAFKVSSLDQLHDPSRASRAPRISAAAAAASNTLGAERRREGGREGGEREGGRREGGRREDGEDMY